MDRAGLRQLAAAAVLLALAAVPAVAGCDKPAPIRFAPGASAAELTGGLARGDRDCFTISARTGQRMTVTQTDRGEGNIVLQLYPPPWTTAPSPDGLVVRGTALSEYGAGPTGVAAGQAGRVQSRQRAALCCRVSTADQSCARQELGLATCGERRL
jgi:hypothetical protein